ncbi:MAG: hypothetical protein WCG27_07530, partial [Pseudomonadota bacterium]
KTPEYFYPIEDREYNKSDKEAHLQLTINLYRKEKWGLMYKAMKLFSQKYGATSDVDLLEYLKANAVLRENMGKNDPAPVKMAINMFRNILERSDNYDLRKGVVKYLVSFYLAQKSYVDVLQMAKEFYGLSKENFDTEESVYAAEVILYSLACIDQVKKIQEFMDDKSIQKLIPKQISLAYQTYVLLKVGNTQEVIKIFQENQKALVDPIHPAILYNVAESYFREANFEAAIKIYDSFLVKYAHFTEASQARIRLALSYEFLEKNYEDTLNLYKHAINRAQDISANYEARIRYVALGSVRKRELNAADRELRVFLEEDKGQKVNYNNNLMKLLWLVRLRTYIVDQQFEDALSYLEAIPVDTLNPTERRVFEADGAEIIYGVLVQSYQKSDFSKIVKVWEVYKDKYLDKVANDPFLNFVVGRAYLKLGLYQGFDRMYASLTKMASGPTKNFPFWVERKIYLGSSEALMELAIIKDLKLGNTDLVDKNLSALEKIGSQKKKINFYKGIIAYQKKNYTDCAKYLETYLATDVEKGDHDVADLADLFNAYADSLYQLAQIDKFKKVVKAIDSDTVKFSENYPIMQLVKERMLYLYIEIIAAEKNVEEGQMTLLPEIAGFLERYPKSQYFGRIKYLQAVSLMANRKEAEGKDILDKLVGDPTVSDYIKGLARSELSMLKIKDRTF